jgi:hypothetical protein
MLPVRLIAGRRCVYVLQCAGRSCAGAMDGVGVATAVDEEARAPEVWSSGTGKVAPLARVDALEEGREG